MSYHITSSLSRHHGGLLSLPGKDMFAETADLIDTLPVQLPGVLVVPPVDFSQALQRTSLLNPTFRLPKAPAEPEQQGPFNLYMDHAYDVQSYRAFCMSLCVLLRLGSFKPNKQTTALSLRLPDRPR